MTSGAFDRIAAIFEAVCDLPAGEQASHLDELCAGDERIRRAVVAMLEADDRTDGFLRTPALGDAIDLSDISRLAAAAPADEPTPDAIGPFEIKGVLGRGGMGIVYRARQSNPARDVALKVIAPGLANAATLRRFEMEIQTLARLRHPGVAQVYDAGVFESAGVGRPWFAMELVEGRPLGEHVRHAALTMTDQIELFLRVCNAVEHAHVKGVVHRDLKPANVLIDADGQPKVLDFGVARALDADAGATLQTQTGQIVGTLAYMSPEQVRGDGEFVDTRSDVYSLGVMLFELLTGALPHDVRKTSVAEAARRICSEPPSRLADHGRHFRGDLDTIVRTALSADVDRRYQSAGALAQDLRRFLADEPIAAHPPSAAYTVRKFAARHRGVFAALVVAAISLVAGTVVSATLAVRATRAEALAEEQRDAARIEAARASAVNAFLNDVLASADPDVTRGRTLTVLEALEDAALEIEDAFDEQPRIEASLRQTIGGAYRNLGQPETARAHLDRAIALFEETGAGESEDAVYARSARALTLLDEGQLQSAISETRTVLADAERLLGPEHDATLRTRNNLAYALTLAGDLENAEAEFQRILETRIEQDGPTDPETLRAESNLIRVWVDQGRVDDAAARLDEFAQRADAALPEGHPLRIARFALAGWIAAARGQWTESVALRRQSVDLAEAVFGPSHPRTNREVGNLAWALNQTGASEIALPLAQRAYDSHLAIGGDENISSLEAMNTLASVLANLGRADEARALHERQLALATRLLGPTHRIALDAQTNLGVLDFHAREFENAESRFRVVYNAHRADLGEDNQKTRAALANLSTAIQQRAPTIEDPAERAAFIASRMPLVMDQMRETPLRTVILREQWVAALHGAGDHEGAVDIGRDLLNLLLDGGLTHHERTIACRSNLARCLAETGQNDAAQAELDAAIESAIVTFGDDDPRIGELRQQRDGV